MMFRKPTLLKRYGDGPIITPADFEGEKGTLADCIFNPGQTMFQGKTLLLVSVKPRNRSYAETHVATSEDGIHFTIAPKPCFFRDSEKIFGKFDNHPTTPASPGLERNITSAVREIRLWAALGCSTNLKVV